MAEKERPRYPTHRAYSVIRRNGQDSFWLNVGLVFPCKDDGGFNIMLLAFPLDGKVVCRETAKDDKAENVEQPALPPSWRKHDAPGRGTAARQR